MMRSQRNAAPLVLLLGFEIAAIIGLQALGSSETMRVPWSDFGTWLQTASTVEIATPLLRLAALVLAYWLFVSTALSVVASLSRFPWASRFADKISLPAVRRVVDGAMIVSITATSVVGSAAGPAFASNADDSSNDVTTSVSVNDAVSTPSLTSLTSTSTTDTVAPTTTGTDAPDTTSTPSTVEADPGDSWVSTPNLPADASTTSSTAAPTSTSEAPTTTSSTAAPDDSQSAVSTPDTGEDQADDSTTTTTQDITTSTTEDQQGSDQAAPDEAPTGGASTPDSGLAAGEHRVVAGENLWSIARDALEQGNSGGSVSESQVRDYWLQVIEANRGNLRSGDPHWIFPGEVVTLPSVPAPAAS